MMDGYVTLTRRDLALRRGMYAEPLDGICSRPAVADSVGRERSHHCNDRTVQSSALEVTSERAVHSREWLAGGWRLARWLGAAWPTLG